MLSHAQQAQTQTVVFSVAVSTRCKMPAAIPSTAFPSWARWRHNCGDVHDEITRAVKTKWAAERDITQHKDPSAFQRESIGRTAACTVTQGRVRQTQIMAASQVRLTSKEFRFSLHGLASSLPRCDIKHADVMYTGCFMRLGREISTCDAIKYKG